MAGEYFREFHCLISSFYIKPQRKGQDVIERDIVLYRLSTSNHNHWTTLASLNLLSYIVFLHQTTTAASDVRWPYDCLISSFYIKPQLGSWLLVWVPYCLISSFYIKPQPSCTAPLSVHHCLISSFYIKPQRKGNSAETQWIVLYRLSTSNHNRWWTSWHLARLSYIVFLHQTTTLFIYSSDYQSVLSYLKQ